MTTAFRNRFLATFAVTVLTVFTATSLVPQKAQSQYMWTCYASSVSGQFFWNHMNIHTARRLVMRACQMNTPIGYVCVAEGCE